MTSRQMYFDESKNKLPVNWTNNNATAYYNRSFWERCKCEYGTKNPCKEIADIFNPTLTEKSKWTNGCNSDYYYKYYPDSSYNKKHKKKCDCDCEEDCDCECGCRKKNNQQYLTSCITNDRCSECKDISIIYRTPNEETDCDNIVELRIPNNGSKEKYLAKYFSPAFVYANRFQCATVPVYNKLPNNQIDNKREVEFTEATQQALTNRGVKNSFIAQQFIDSGKIINEKNAMTIPMNVFGRSSYYYFGNSTNSGNTNTGLVIDDIAKGYFGTNV